MKRTYDYYGVCSLESVEPDSSETTDHISYGDCITPVFWDLSYPVKTIDESMSVDNEEAEKDDIINDPVEEAVVEEIPDKRIKLDNIDDNIDEGNDEEKINLEVIRKFHDISEIDIIERQVIGKALASVKRSNMNDWNFEINVDGGQILFTNELAIISDDLKDYDYQVVCELTRIQGATSVQIRYRLDGEISFEKLRIVWLNDTSDPRLIIFKDVVCYWLWAEERQYCIYPEDCEEDNWCWFDDARRHINRISFH